MPLVPSPVRERDRVRGVPCPDRPDPTPQPSPERERGPHRASSDRLSYPIAPLAIVTPPSTTIA
ncbi:hypothetical protein FV234_02040 [Methylobacterium sp. WL8]|nr:hypothetical protein FV234_02040 [Methylobacterium sp. WL8]